MLLAQALIARADNQKRIAQLRERLAASVKVQDGDAPPEDPKELLGEIERLVGETEGLIKRINHTNNIHRLADSIVERDMLLLHQSILRQVAEAATITQGRYSRSEVRYVSTVDVAALQKKADGLARQARHADDLLQAANWQTELEE